MFRFKKYKVDYCGEKGSYKGAKDAYRAGRKVTFYFDFIATDTDYAFYIDGIRIDPLYREGRGFEISFRMPAHDITVRYEEWNTMLPPEERNAQ